VVPKKLIGKSSKNAKASVRKAGCRAIVKYKRTKKAKESGKVLKVAPASGAVLPANSNVTITVGRRR
jgi:beta-lactam-binding protein with PASTA domain